MRSSSPASRHLLIYLFVAAVTILAGLALRRLNLHLPVAVVKYGGSALWAMMIYWLVAAVRPAWRPGETGFVSALIAALVEFFKLYHSSALDAFRRTLAGTLLLGRYFSLLDVGVYCIAIACVAWIDSRVLRRG